MEFLQQDFFEKLSGVMPSGGKPGCRFGDKTKAGPDQPWGNAG
jgi:hypothetical protein